MLTIFSGLEFETSAMLVLALLFVLFYEAINGFHDTANAIATVIYTRAMREKLAVTMAGICNFFGVLLGGLSVAYTIVHLLPTDMLLNISSTQGLAMVFSILLAAIIWNLGTWYFGIPASSSHTLIGAIIGVGLMNALMTHSSVVDAINIPKMIDIFLSLIISPIIGLVLAGGMVYLLRRIYTGSKKRKRIHMTPAQREKIDGKRKPPFWTRIMLILSAIGVSFSHGANDGQKGIGLLMLVLIGIAPAGFIVNMNASSYDLIRTRTALSALEHYFDTHSEALNIITQKKPQFTTVNNSNVQSQTMHQYHCNVSSALKNTKKVLSLFNNIETYQDLNIEQRSQTRRLLLCVAESVSVLIKSPETKPSDARQLSKLRKDLLETVEYAPLWIVIAVALALAIGTMIGWRRVATTIGEKIGKTEMTYAQGVSAQTTTALSIGVASFTGMPVSTTQILSSAVAGTMIVDGGGIQRKTLRNIALTWLLTLPIAVTFSASLYWLALQII